MSKKDREAHRAWDREYQRRRRQTPAGQARRKLQRAVAQGTIWKPDVCQRCGNVTPPRRLHGHHARYDRPLEVEWLCTSCHAHRDRRKEISD